MPVKSTFSQRSSLEAIQDLLRPLATDSNLSDALGDVSSHLSKIDKELRTLRTGFEAYQWEEEVGTIE